MAENVLSADTRTATGKGANRKLRVTGRIPAIVYGKGRVQEGGGAELLQKLAHVYFGDERRFPDMDDPPAGYVLRITPERVTGWGPWKD